MGVDAAPMAIIAELYMEFEGKLRSYARQLTRESAWAEDLVQDTFTRAMLHLDLLRLLNIHQRRAWLYTTLKRRFLDEQAAQHRQDALLQQLDAATLSTSDPPPAAAPNPFDLVPEQHQELVHMRFVLGMNSTEIAEELGIPAATVRSRLHLAVKHLRYQKFKFE